ncbi:hypothetical protein G6F22_019165 [Rhizopus arrhizus]|uniref:Uncharacterized protein n=1 Tax=Rhizopus delemar TaxID=936053 RepID=A0A9P6XYN8_9FUNG|nr:hypothetical protein G6F22_019165 [Rhizopus arrhizus]KAG1534798.1 hypothetical protein G6F50_015474 [Rhizopus delemar]
MFGAFTLRPICALIVISDCMNLRESKFWKAGPFCRAALPTDIALSPARVDMPTSTWVVAAKAHLLLWLAVAFAAVAFKGDHFNQVCLSGEVPVEHGRCTVLGHAQVLLGLGHRFQAAAGQRLLQLPAGARHG